MDQSAQQVPSAAAPARMRPLSLRATLLLVWAVASFGVVFFARDVNLTVAGWPLNFWYCSQGAILVFMAIVTFYAWRRNRESAPAPDLAVAQAQRRYGRSLHRKVAIYVTCLVAFLVLMAMAERAGMPRAWIGGIFLFSTLALYAGIGIYCRTSVPVEYYVAGRRVPAMYNGMATAADWMSAASFISLAGGLYLQGFSGTETQPGGLAYILGWTGGFCLVALLIAPKLRSMDLYTVPDYFGMRFGGRWPRLIAAMAAILCSFTYVVAQIYGVGLITSSLIGVQFEIGILLGLGGVLVCSFLGGMRAVTWTQVAQYLILILAFLVPVSWLAYKQLGSPVAMLVYGQQLEKIAVMEQQLAASPAEQTVVDEYRRRAVEFEHKLLDVDAALARERTAALARLRDLKGAEAEPDLIQAAARELAALPKNPADARESWTRARQDNLDRAKPLAGMLPHRQAFAGDPNGAPQEREIFQASRLNFLALVFCLMVGTAGLPHLLTRYYTTTSVPATRKSVAWSLLFIALLYLAAPALAVLVKYEVLSQLVGLRFESLPAWIAQWTRVDPSLLSVTDVNGDGILQFAELRIAADIVMLATPELGGLPYVISGLVAAGGLAAALSTADGLLLTISNAIAHDLYFQGVQERANSINGVMLSKFALLLVALAAAHVAAQKPADILYLVSASFSLAAAAFVPAMVLGIFWRRTTRRAAVAGMLLGLGITLYYMVINVPSVRHLLGLVGSGLWFGIQPISAGVFGVPAGALAIWLLSMTNAAESPRDERRLDGI